MVHGRSALPHAPAPGSAATRSTLGLWVLRPLGIAQVVVVVLHLLLHLLHLLAVLVEDVLAHKVGTLELLAREGTEPLVLAQLLGVGLDKLLDLKTENM